MTKSIEALLMAGMEVGLRMKQMSESNGAILIWTDSQLMMGTILTGTAKIEVTKGQMFHDKAHLQHAVKKCAFAEKKPFKVVISNPTLHDLKCLSPGCPWRVHGYQPKCETTALRYFAQPIYITQSFICLAPCRVPRKKISRTSRYRALV